MTEQIIAIIGTIGGIEGALHLAKWWFSRKATKRQDEAQALALENENYRQHTDWMEKRIDSRDAKIDGLYAELRNAQKQHLDEIHSHQETKLSLIDAECKKCLKRGCSDRVPPSEY